MPTIARRANETADETRRAIKSPKTRSMGFSGSLSASQSFPGSLIEIEIETETTATHTQTQTQGHLSSDRDQWSPQDVLCPSHSLSLSSCHSGTGGKKNGPFKRITVEAQFIPDGLFSWKDRSCSRVRIASSTGLCETTI